MSILSENIRFLRNQKQYSQQKLADELTITRARYSKYEEGVSEPPLDILQRIARYFHVSIDLLISKDLREVDMDGLLQLEGNRLLLPVKVKSSGENYIEIIPHKAKAGYKNSYSDPEYIENLQHVSLPFLREGKYRAFPVSGDSMPPHTEGSFIVGKYIESLAQLKKGKTFVIVTKTEGIIYKRLAENKESTLVLTSDNTFYEPYEVKKSDVLEIWQYEMSLATNEYEPDDLSAGNVRYMFQELKKGINGIQAKLK